MKAMVVGIWYLPTRHSAGKLRLLLYCCVPYKTAQAHGRKRGTDPWSRRSRASGWTTEESGSKYRLPPLTGSGYRNGSPVRRL